MIGDFIVNKMASYISGGMSAETAARFARGELGAIYRGRHYRRNGTGQWQTTPPPENIPVEAARTKCNEAIKEILDCCADDTKEKPQALDTTFGKKNGLEGLKNYVNRKPA